MGGLLVGALAGCALGYLGSRLRGNEGQVSLSESFREHLIRRVAANARPVIWTAALVVGLALLAGSWGFSVLSSLECRDPVTAGAVVRQVEAEVRRRDAIPASRNGFTVLAPVLRYPDTAPEGRLYEGLSAFYPQPGYTPGEDLRARLYEGVRAFYSEPSTSCSFDEGALSRWAKFRRAQPEAIDRALSGFRRVLPRIREALSRPEFAPPSHWEEGGPRAHPINYSRMRGIAQGLVVMGLDAELRGDLDEALDHYLTGLTWGNRLSGSGPLDQEMFAVDCEEIALEALLRLVAAGELTPGQLRRVLEALEQSRFDPGNLGRSMDREYAFGRRVFEFLRQGRLDPEDLGIAERWLPAWRLHYEEQVYTDLFLACRDPLWQLGDPGRVKLMLDQKVQAAPPCPLAEHLFPRGVDLDLLRYRRLLNSFEGVRALTALRLYRLERGTYPGYLGDLVEAGYLRRPPRDVDGVEFPYRPAGDDFKLLVFPSFFKAPEGIHFFPECHP